MIPFNKPYLTGNEVKYINEVLTSRRFSGDGRFSKKCAHWMEKNLNCKKAILVPSGTAALEMMMLLADIKPGDEVIMPSFTFSSTANAVVLRNATPVFIDIRPDTLNIDEKQIEAAITPKTKAICPVHYAGVPCEMDTIIATAKKYNLLVLNDAAQAILSKYKDNQVCSMGDMSAVSFHETKNIQCGEGGALLINNPQFIERAEIIMEKGTDRSKFIRGEVDRYTWVDLGSSMLINEITAAFLWAQLEYARIITSKRLELWNKYNEAFLELDEKNIIKKPKLPVDCKHNGHIYYLLTKNSNDRDVIMDRLKEHKIHSTFHYIPLDSAKAGGRFTHKHPNNLPITSDISSRILRMPLYYELDIDKTIKLSTNIIESVIVN
ncbi:dTDP-4-amino-4,6-dideoxygalactose transaminase [Cloacibacillus evryensis]|nr:dTDP-4-amino-4,6-dideoxygalactose transaminase [Cloacibacillus evryensis]